MFMPLISRLLFEHFEWLPSDGGGDDSQASQPAQGEEGGQEGENNDPDGSPNGDTAGDDKDNKNDNNKQIAETEDEEYKGPRWDLYEQCLLIKPIHPFLSIG